MWEESNENPTTHKKVSQAAVLCVRNQIKNGPHLKGLTILVQHFIEVANPHNSETLLQIVRLWFQRSYRATRRAQESNCMCNIRGIEWWVCCCRFNVEQQYKGIIIRGSDEYVVANSMLSERLIFNTWVSLVITMPSLRFTPQSKFTVQCLMPAFENQLKTNSLCTFASLHS